MDGGAPMMMSVLMEGIAREVLGCEVCRMAEHWGLNNFADWKSWLCCVCDRPR